MDMMDTMDVMDLDTRPRLGRQRTVKNSGKAALEPWDGRWFDGLNGQNGRYGHYYGQPTSCGKQ